MTKYNITYVICKLDAFGNCKAKGVNKHLVMTFRGKPKEDRIKEAIMDQVDDWGDPQVCLITRITPIKSRKQKV